jgi:serine/threonine protein phosphatase PrpC
MPPTSTPTTRIQRLRKRAFPRYRSSPSSPEVRLDRLLGCMAFTTAFSFTSILFAWFNHSSSMEMDFQHKYLLPASSATLSSFNTSRSFLDSSSCRQSRACQIHYPVTMLVSDTFHESNSDTSDRHNKDFYLLTTKGYKEGPNQDRSFLLSPVGLSPDSSLLSQSSQSTHMDNAISNNNNMLMVGLFDGHAQLGHLTAEAALEEMPQRLLANLEREQSLVSNANLNANYQHQHYPSPAVVHQVLETTFLQVDQGSRIQQIQNAGSTAVVALQMGPTVYLASAGDSTAFVARYRRKNSDNNGSNSHDDNGETVILSTARRHKPADPDERARIVAHGGTVWIPPDPSQTSRVVIGAGLALAMSRCFGDLLGKPSGVLIAQPTIETLNLLEHVDDGENDEFFVVVASDGVVDFMPIQHVAEKVAASLYETSGSGFSLGQTCHSLIQESSGLWHAFSKGTYRDDMTLVVSKISL